MPEITAPQSAVVPLGKAGLLTGVGRLTSLDAFRGFTMMLMILVNSAGSTAVYRQLAHTPWHGLTLADLIFPSFIWIVGITTTLALGSRIATTTKSMLAKQALLRAVKMYALGLCLYAAPHFSLTTQRLMGVLQRIAICYLAGSLLYLFTSRKIQMVCIFVLLGGYWAVMTMVPAPGFATGDLSMHGNLAHYVDRIVLGAHNYAATKTWDPEGILSTLPAIATMLLGVMAGNELRRQVPLSKRLRSFAMAGCVLLAAGVIVNHSFPINKKLWTSSFVLVAAGIDFLVLPLFTYAIDVKGSQRFLQPFTIMGMNAITIYMISELLDQGLSLAGWKTMIFAACFARFGMPQTASFLYAAAFTLLMYGIAYVMYRKRIFIRI